MSTLRSKLMSLGLMAGLVGGGLAIHETTRSAHASPGAAAAALTDASIPDVAERVVESVVNISTHAVQKGPAAWDPFFTDPDSPGFGEEPSLRKQMSKGSGVIVTSGGRILTNAHVVKGASEITVSLHDGSEHLAKVLGIDSKADLAVLQLEGKVPKLRPLALGDSGTLRLGEVVLAIGDPFGVGKSVTMGIVSAKGRSGMRIETYEDFIQTDAAINPGNSGGALVNLKGELVGINTAIASPNGGYAGIGFAIPTNMARPIMEELVKHGKVTRGFLGVSITTVTPAIAKEYNLGASRGTAIVKVSPNSPAHKAGLTEGDVVTAINGAEVRTDDVFSKTIAAIKPGSVVELSVTTQDNTTKIVKAKLGELPEDTHGKAPALRRRR